MTVVTFAGAQTSEPSLSPGALTSGPAAASSAHTASPAVTLGTEPDIALQLFWDWINQSKVPFSKDSVQRRASRNPRSIMASRANALGYSNIEQPTDGEQLKGSAPPVPGVAGSGAAASATRTPRAQAPVAMRTAPGAQPVPGGLTGSLAKVGLNALVNVKQ